MAPEVLCTKVHVTQGVPIPDQFGKSWTQVKEEYTYNWQSKFARPSKPECVIINMKRTIMQDNSTIPFEY